MDEYTTASASGAATAATPSTATTATQTFTSADAVTSRDGGGGAANKPNSKNGAKKHDTSMEMKDALSATEETMRQSASSAAAMSPITSLRNSAAAPATKPNSPGAKITNDSSAPHSPFDPTLMQKSESATLSSTSMSTSTSASSNSKNEETNAHSDVDRAAPPAPALPTTETPLHPYRLQSGEEIDAKNTLRSHSVIVARVQQLPHSQPTQALPMHGANRDAVQDKLNGEAAAATSPAAAQYTARQSRNSNDEPSNFYKQMHGMEQAAAVTAVPDINAFDEEQQQQRNSTSVSSLSAPSMGLSTMHHGHSTDAATISALVLSPVNEDEDHRNESYPSSTTGMDEENPMLPIHPLQLQRQSLQQQQPLHDEHQPIFATALVLDASCAMPAACCDLPIQSIHPDSMTHHTQTTGTNTNTNTTGSNSNSNSNTRRQLNAETEGHSISSNNPTIAPSTDPTNDGKRFGANRTTSSRRGILLAATGIVLVVVVSVVASLATACDKDGCTSPRSRSSKSNASNQRSPNSSNSQIDSAPPDRATELGAFINSVTLSGRTIAVLSATSLSSAATTNQLVEEQALRWLIHEDELPLRPDGPYNQFRLQQRYALRTFFELIDDGGDNEAISQSSRFTNATASECDWFGITCQSVTLENGETRDVVTEIELGAMNLTGSLSADIVLLPAVVRFDVSSNSLSGPLSQGLGAWTDLQVFDIGYNLGISGSIPTSFGNWTALTHFTAAENDLVGSLPTEVGQWTRLVHFNVFRCSLKGTLPESIGQWVDLEHFDVGDNALTGPLPSSIRQWSNILNFDAGHSSEGDYGINRMTGSLPDELGQWTALKSFNISFNRFTGDLPESLGNWTSLEVVDMREVSTITGALSPSFAQWTNIREFTVSGNTLVGSLPAFLAAWTNIEIFDINDNSFTGQLPEAYSQWTKLWYFDIQFNKIGGSIPQEFGQWSNIIYVAAAVNLLSGSLPSTLGNWTDMLFFSVSTNAITGTLPEALGQWSMIDFFQVNVNELTSSIPDSFGQWSNMVTFLVADNALTGTVPMFMENWTMIDEISLEGNNFTGTISEGICDGTATTLVADCISEVTCTCCTSCK